MTCTICRLPERMRDEIELMLAQGWPYRRVASAFGVTRSTTHRHARHAERPPETAQPSETAQTAEATASQFFDCAAALAARALYGGSRSLSQEQRLQWLAHALDVLPNAWRTYRGGGSPSLRQGMVLALQK